jgi:hydrogenase nickel incorporation protein HypA/HybF
MHELSLTHEIVCIVCEAARGHRIRNVRLEIGAMSCVSPEAIEFCFQAVVQGTLAEGARLDIHHSEGDACHVATIEVEEIA